MDDDDIARVRADILQAFGVTEDDMAALEAIDGYEAARREAQQLEADYVEWMRLRLAEIAEQISGDLPGDMRFEWRENPRAIS